MIDSTIILLAVFITGMLVIYIEYKLDYPWGIYDGLVWMYIPPFLKRIRIFGYWIGFSKEWKFMFFKKE